MRLHYIAEDLNSKIVLLARKYFNNSPRAMEKVLLAAKADPTPNKAYLDWITRMLAKQTIRLPEDSDKVSERLAAFHNLKRSARFKAEYPADINRYQSYGDLAKAIDSASGISSNRSDKARGRDGKLALPPGAELVFDNGTIQAVKITRPQAASVLCSGTEWCVANEGHANDYLKDGPLFLIYENGQRSVLAHWHTGSFMDVYDKQIPDRERLILMKMLEGVSGYKVSDDPKDSYDYALHVVGGRWPEGEPTILTDKQWIQPYARNVIKGRWPEGERVLLEKGHLAELAIYAAQIIKGRWPEIEHQLATDAYASYCYAKGLDERFPEGEKEILTDPNMLYVYARDVIKGRWPEGERVLLQLEQTTNNIMWVFNYNEVIVQEMSNSKWPEGERFLESWQPHQQ